MLPFHDRFCASEEAARGLLTRAPRLPRAILRLLSLALHRKGLPPLVAPKWRVTRLFHRRDGLDGLAKVLREEVAVSLRLRDRRVPEGFLDRQERDSALNGP